MSNFGNREQLFTADINFADRIKPIEFDVSLQRTFAAIDCKNKSSENKASISCDSVTNKNNVSYDSVINGKSNFLDFSLNDDSKDWQSPEFKKNNQCIKKSYINELKELEDSPFKDITKTNMNGSLSKPFKIHDKLFCESFQNILSDVPCKNLAREKCSYFYEESEDVCKYLENSVNYKNFDCKSNSDNYKIGSSKHRNSFLKQPISLKPIASSEFDKLSDQKSSRT